MRARAPFSRDPSLDYEVMSDEDWEEEPEGESLSVGGQGWTGACLVPACRALPACLPGSPARHLLMQQLPLTAPLLPARPHRTTLMTVTMSAAMVRRRRVMASWWMTATSARMRAAGAAGWRGARRRARRGAPQVGCGWGGGAVVACVPPCLAAGTEAIKRCDPFLHGSVSEAIRGPRACSAAGLRFAAAS